MPESLSNPMDRVKFNLRTKLMLIFLALVLVPLVAIGWFSVKTTEDLIVDMVNRQLHNVAVDKIALLEHWLNERKTDLTVVAETSLLKSMDPDLIGPYLNLLRRQYGVYKDFTVISASGELVFTSRTTATPFQGFQVSRTLSMSDIAYADEEKESTFYISVPVFKEDGRLLGTIYARVGTNKIVFTILTVSLGKTGECYLVDRDGRFLAHKDPSRILSENITQTGSFKNIFEKRNSKKTYLDYRGIEVLGTSLHIKGTDWYIVVEQDLAEAFESSNKLKFIVYLTIFFGIVSAMMLTWIISRHIVRPIRTLSRYATSIADSRFDETVLEIKRGDEIGMLYKAFSHMFSKLKERQNDLEQKVERKEAELKETDIILKKTRFIAERSEKFAAMGRMGAAVAHEIRTPLTSLKLYLESVEGRLDPSPEDMEDFHVALGQIQRMEGTINRFLDFAKPRDLVFSMVDIPHLVNDVIMMVKPLANRQECSLEMAVAKDLPTMKGDRRRLTEALINLVVNALESMEARGTITIFASLDRTTTIPSIRIDVNDTGQGISDDQIDHIFEPFFTTKASGTGLGLSLVLQTVKSHGGTIQVKSSPHEGTTFSLYLSRESREPDGDDGKNTDH